MRIHVKFCCAKTNFNFLDLLREMQEIESQRALVPPVPASAVKDHLWVGEYHNELVQNNVQVSCLDHFCW